VKEEASLLERASFEGRRALVLGLGRFAGGLETVRFLRTEGADVLVSDAASRDALAEPAAEAEALGARLSFGPQEPALLEGRDVVIANPAMPFGHPVLEAARRADVPVTTEINIVLARSPAPIHAVTGTKGKSTTATMLASMLESAGLTVHLGGNIGRPLIARLGQVAATDHLVLELSSFQLWWTRRIERSPDTTLVTNLLSDHLDRHGTHAEYARAKRAALDFQRQGDLAVLPADDAAVAAAGYREAGAARRMLYGEGGEVRLEGERVVWPAGSADISGLPFPGTHNLRNALAAAAACLAITAGDGPAVTHGVRSARRLPHRLSPVGEVAGVLYVDDSNATHPDSALLALAAFNRPVVLILGGKDKGVDIQGLLDGAAAGAKAVVAVGASAQRVSAALTGRVPVVPGGPDMAAAVRAAADLAAAGDVVLLSPGHSSLDEYASFAERGQRFTEAVEALGRASTGP
jgi:UDP-N-acetylmuramoylalanine--D-glutamate ligase